MRALARSVLSRLRAPAPGPFGRYEVLTGPAVVRPAQPVPAGTVHRPPYADTGRVPPSTHPIINTAADVAELRRAGRLVRDVLDYAQTVVQVGVTTDEVDRKLHAFMLARDLYPSPLNYKGFPKSVCTSVNNVVCHGIPDTRPLADGDIVNVDVTVYTRAGYHGDSSRTFLVGDVDEPGRAVVRAAHDAMMRAIDACRPGEPVNVIGNAIEDHVQALGFSTNRIFCGHGINRDFHTDPLVHHCRNNDMRRLEPGMVFTIEPIVNQGTTRVWHWADGWTIATLDGARSAQFEHMVLITDRGVDVLTA